ncbi:unnamed protein product [Rangifer tarandus platyrhynchus]|uniref:Uncharacterized protein n=1 Tax=Rangifer tarandus platyrhynchus TaxID=3082113 RepID=A0ABN8ZDJ0_RANTA|nr:unnamed protein product [Rangifer tarandus platyrhynchus]
MTVMGPGCQEQAEIRAEDAGSCQQSCQRYLFPSIQTSVSLGLWMDLVCSVQEKIMSWLLQHELLSLLPRRKVMTLEEGFGGGGRLTLDIAQSCSVMRCCNCSTRSFPKAVADSFPKTKQLSFLYLWLRSHYVTCPP